ncbi:hypothetical protein GGS20DRAFT_505442 [Poronia punctata]|nr:hypothetical protein GGS20DRAFT_505442 [Poronia punctata]
MKPSTILSGLLGLALTSLTSASELTTTTIYIQPVTGSATTQPLPLAEIQYDLTAPAESQILSYEAPELSEETKLVRVGVYDVSAKKWTSSTSVASVANFEKGYSPSLLLTVDGNTGVPVGAALRGVAIDAGQTRDFGPKAVVLVTEKGGQPELNKPVVLSPEGKQVVPEEKTMFQKYWWVIGLVVVMSMISGGDDKK